MKPRTERFFPRPDRNWNTVCFFKKRKFLFYTDNSVEGEGSPDLDGEPSDHCTYSPLAEGYELSSKPDCSETLRAAYREAHPSPEVWREEMEAMMAIALYGGGDEA